MTSTDCRRLCTIITFLTVFCVCAKVSFNSCHQYLGGLFSLKSGKFDGNLVQHFMCDSRKFDFEIIILQGSAHNAYVFLCCYSFILTNTF
jgi:hypothetical protein